MSDRVCECGRAIAGSVKKCSKCTTRERAQAEINESIRRQFNPEHTPLMFGDEEKK